MNINYQYSIPFSALGEPVQASWDGLRPPSSAFVRLRPPSSGVRLRPPSSGVRLRPLFRNFARPTSESVLVVDQKGLSDVRVRPLSS